MKLKVDKNRNRQVLPKDKDSGAKEKEKEQNATVTLNNIITANSVIINYHNGGDTQASITPGRGSTEKNQETSRAEGEATISAVDVVMD